MSWGLLLACVLWLPGCAGITAKVTNFNAWPADAKGASFAFLQPAGQAGDLEQETYQSYVSQQLEKQGLRPAAAGQAARFLVEVSASGGTRSKTYLEPIYQQELVFIPPRRDSAGNVFPGYWAPDQFGSRYVGDRQVTRIVQIARLRLRLLDTQGASAGQPRPVFDSTGLYEGDDEDLPVLVPYLVRAVFDGFPGRNGQVATLGFDSRTGEVSRRKLLSAKP